VKIGKTERKGEAMKTGEILHRFTAKDGREVILRTLQWKDLDDLLEYINSMVDEGADIVMDHKVTRDEETDWLRRRLAAIDKGNVIDLVAEVDGKVVANSELAKKEGYSSHIGEIGIAIKQDYRDIGIGTEMLKTLIAEAEKTGLKTLTLRAFSTNKRAIRLYERVGFKATGRISKKFYKNGRYIDEITMTKEI